MNKYVENILQDAVEVHKKFSLDSSTTLVEMSKIIVDCFHNGGKVLICGNGGSAADAQHLAAEFANRFVMERPPLPAIAMTTDTSLLTAIGNDYSYEEIFEKQVKALCNKNDVVWGISTSGNSKNVVRALRAAEKIGAKTIGFSGGAGGEMRGLCDSIIVVDSPVTARIQEIHILSGHIICGLVDEMMFGEFVGR